jgi:2-keto-3-deoxy-galactonokinase
MKCKKCNSEDLTIILSGPHQKLVCCDCLTFQKFLTVKEAKIFLAVKKQKAEVKDGAIC